MKPVKLTCEVFPLIVAAAEEGRTGSAVGDFEVRIMVLGEGVVMNLGSKVAAGLEVFVEVYSTVAFAGNWCFEAALARLGKKQFANRGAQSAEG